jgi:hypothetical protein
MDPPHDQNRSGFGRTPQIPNLRMRRHYLTLVGVPFCSYVVLGTFELEGVADRLVTVRQHSKPRRRVEPSRQLQVEPDHLGQCSPGSRLAPAPRRSSFRRLQVGHTSLPPSPFPGSPSFFGSSQCWNIIQKMTERGRVGDLNTP